MFVPSLLRNSLTLQKKQKLLSGAARLVFGDVDISKLQNVRNCCSHVAMSSL